jgi:hypothetical protein
MCTSHMNKWSVLAVPKLADLRRDGQSLHDMACWCKKVDGKGGKEGPFEGLGKGERSRQQ